MDTGTAVVPAAAMSAGCIPRDGRSPESDPKHGAAARPKMNRVKASVTKRRCFLGARCIKIIPEPRDNEVVMEPVFVPVYRFTELGAEPLSACSRGLSIIVRRT
ncbi:hypothetical protein DESC_600097 [Desulfosarcina cetonica]|nr:hypothetical protein DESC_600097 [Desulfosarcina cetonica]